jgi:hypothetical protein
MDAYQQQYKFSVDEAVKKWRTLIANDGILLEKEFNVCFKFSIKFHEHYFHIRLFESSIQIV